MFISCSTDNVLLKYFPESYSFSGEIPMCILDMPKLEELYLSGNALSGDLPVLPMNSTIQVLHVKNNYLSGSIPDSYFKHNFRSINLVSNKLIGVLRQPRRRNDNLNNRNVVDYTLNRLSGPIPTRYKEMSNIEILNGNLFECSLSGEELPEEDPGYNDYSCGSNQLDISMIALSFILVLVCIVILMTKWRSHLKTNGTGSSDSENAPFCRSNSIFIANTRAWKLLEHSVNWYTVAISLTSDRPDRQPELVDLCIKPSHLGEVSRYVASLLLIRGVAILVACMIMLVCSPLYIAFHDMGYSTHDYTYSWTITSGFLHGSVPAVFLGLVWILLCLFFTQVLLIGNTYVFGGAIKKQKARIQSAVFQSLAGTNESRTLICKSIGAIGANAIVVLAATSAYVFGTVSHDVSNSGKIILQWAFALFKVVWNTFGVPVCFYAIQNIQRATRVSVYLSTLYFNNVIGVIVAAFFVSDNCFRGAFSEGDQEYVTYEYDICTSYNFLRRCNGVELEQYSSGFEVPFLYRYTCHNAVLRAFLPIFFYSYTALTFLLPLSYLLLALTTKERVPRFFRKTLPSILWPNSEIGSGEKLMMPNNVMVSQVAHLFTIVTFGFTCPPLALLIALCVSFLCTVWIVIIGRYIDMKLCSKPRGSMDSSFIIEHRDLIDRSFKDAWRTPVDSIQITFVVAGVFYGVLLFDIMGDTKGLIPALSLSASVFLMMVLFRFLVRPEKRDSFVDSLHSYTFVDVPYRDLIVKTLIYLSGLQAESEEQNYSESVSMGSIGTFTGQLASTDSGALEGSLTSLGNEDELVEDGNFVLNPLKRNT